MQLAFKDKDYEARLVTRRVIVGGAVMLLLLGAVLARVFYLTVVRHEHFTTLSQANRVKILPVAPTRGLIYDRTGRVLAENRPAFRLELVPEQIEDLDALLTELGRIMTIEARHVQRLKASLSKQRRFENAVLRADLSEAEVAAFAVNRHRFAGVDVVAGLRRHYPLGAELAHALGYVARIDAADLKGLDQARYSGTSHIGKLGIERAYESVLHGAVGYRQVEVNAEGRVIRVLEQSPPRPGRDLRLTIDVSLQHMALAELAGRRGAIVALDPRNGDILTLASSPAYDPNLFVNGIDGQTYRALLGSAEKPLLNRALQGEYPPGSTLKPFLALVSLAEGVRDWRDQSWCPGWFSLAGQSHRYRDWKKEGHGRTGLRKAIVESCDVYFYRLAHALGIDRIARGLARYGFGQASGIDIGGERGGLLPSRAWKRAALGEAWFPGETLIIGIGQGYTLTTPLQLAKATAILANRGRAPRPRLVFAISDPGGNEITALPPVVESGVGLAEPGDWDEVIQALRDVAHGPTGTARQSGLGAGYSFAGKTGTAQVIGIAQGEEYIEEEIPEQFQDHALFIAFAPVEAPRIALAIVVENGGSGAQTAAPIARRLFDHFMSRRALISRG